MNSATRRDTQTRSRLRWLGLPVLLLATTLLSALWAISTPTPTGADTMSWANFHPDESSHIAVIRYLSQNPGRLPPYERPFDTSVHPPLYHLLAGWVYAAASPLLGDHGSFLLIRLLTCFCGVGVVYLTVRAAGHLAGQRAALLAGAIVALVPMRVSIGGSINNENLAALGAAGVLATLVGGIADRRRPGFPARRLALLAFWMVVGIGSKVTCLGLLLAAAPVLYFAAARQRARKEAKSASLFAASPFFDALRQFAILCGGTAVVWGWWFARNLRLYGDPLRKTAADRLWSVVQPGFAVMARRQHLTAARYLLSLLAGGWRSFWGVFDGFSRLMPVPIYLALFAFQVATLLGLARAFVLCRRRTSARRDGVRLVVGAAFGIYALFVLAIFVSFNWAHYSPQGRYFFVLLLPFGIVSAIGWRALFPPKQRFADGLLIVVFVALNVYLLCVVPRRLPFFLGRSMPIYGTVRGSVIQLALG